MYTILNASSNNLNASTGEKDQWQAFKQRNETEIEFSERPVHYYHAVHRKNFIHGLFRNIGKLYHANHSINKGSHIKFI